MTKNEESLIHIFIENNIISADIYLDPTNIELNNAVLKVMDNIKLKIIKQLINQTEKNMNEDQEEIVDVFNKISDNLPEEKKVEFKKMIEEFKSMHQNGKQLQETLQNLANTMKNVSVEERKRITKDVNGSIKNILGGA